MKRTKVLVVVVLGCCAGIMAKAQPSTAAAAAQQQQNAEAQQQMLASLKAGTNAPSIYEGEESDVGPQHILRVKSHRTHFQVKADSEYLYTDNAFLSPVMTFFPKPQPTTIFINTLSVALAPEPYRLGNGRFAPTVGLQNQWFNYSLGGPNNLQFNDFDVESAFIGGRYLLPSSWTLFGQLEYNRFVNQNNYYDDFYHDYSPTIGAQKVAKLNSDVLATFGVHADYHDTWTLPSKLLFPRPPEGQEDRADLAADFTLNWQAAPHLIFQPYYRFQYSYYRYDLTGNLTGRNDELHSVGLAAVYYFTQNFSIRAFFNQDVRMSSDPFAKYHAYSLGANATYTLRF